MNRQTIKKYFYCIMFVVVLVALSWYQVEAADSFPEKSGLVNDFADVIDPAVEERINSITGELLSKTDIPVVVATMPDIGDNEYNDYANRLYEKWGIGKKGVDKGVLIFVTVKERKMRIEVGYGLEGVITDGTAGEIRDRYMTPYLRQNKYGEGILNGASALSLIIANASGVELSGEAQVGNPSAEDNPRLSFWPIAIFVIIVLIGGRGISRLLLLPMLMGSGSYRATDRYRDSGFGGFGGGFGGFGGGGSGGFGGFGGGMSGGGGAGGGF